MPLDLVTSPRGNRKLVRAITGGCATDNEEAISDSHDITFLDQRCTLLLSFVSFRAGSGTFLGYVGVSIFGI